MVAGVARPRSGWRAAMVGAVAAVVVAAPSLARAGGGASPKPAASPSAAATATAAGAGPIVERFGPARVDFSAGTVSIEGAAAADLHAPNAGVARVRAERAARAIAARRLAAALADVSLSRVGCKVRPAPATLDAAAARAPAERIEWSSDGSVALELRIPLADLAVPGPQAAPDAGTPGTPVLLVQVGEEPTWFREEAGVCAAAPRHFHTVTEARSAGGELAAAQLVLSRQTLVQPQQGPGAGHFAPLPRVVAIARRDDTGVGSSR